MEYVKNYIISNLDEHLTIKHLSNKALMSQTNFKIKFKEYFGVNSKQYISDLRLELSKELRGIRLDIFSFDEERTIYNAEMQKNNTYNLRKRIRYYQAHMYVSLLEPGEINFNKLNDSYMVMIMPFDLFGKNRYRYTFHYTCEEDSNIELKDGAIKIFLNTKGTNKEEVSQELIDFLQFVEDSSKLPGRAEENERLKRMSNPERNPSPVR